jgi:hypothetical protein
MKALASIPEVHLAEVHRAALTRDGLTDATTARREHPRVPGARGRRALAELGTFHRSASYTAGGRRFGRRLLR